MYDIYGICKILIFSIPAHLIALLCFCILASSIKFLLPKNNSKQTFLSQYSDLRFPFGEKKTTTVLICVLSCFVILFSNAQFVTMLGSRDIRTMPEGTYCYYVKTTNEKGKTYTLPAKIQKINGTYYDIDNVYFKNGGYLYFEDSEYIEYSETLSTYDQNGKDWDIKLTNHKCSHDKVEETKPMNFKKLVLPFIEVLLIISTALMYIFNSVKKEKHEY